MEPISSPAEFFEARKHLISGYKAPTPPRDRYWLHALLFVLTLVSTVFAGGQLASRILAYTTYDGTSLLSLFLDPTFLLDGLRFGGSLLLFLTAHEFGHYFAARYHGINASLPYYIPTLMFGFGTLGAVIRIREPIPSTRKLFDVGVSGPLVGFVFALGVLLYALFTLPGLEYVDGFFEHEALKAYIDQYGRFPERARDLLRPEDQGVTIVIGQTPLFWMLTQFFDNVPPMDELHHYPMLLAGWMGLFFTALNLLPVGQLDGGHILYTLVGPKWHVRLARTFLVMLLISGAIGFVEDVFPELRARSELLGQFSWFILAGILYFYLYKIWKGNHRVIAPVLLGIILLVVVLPLVYAGESTLGYSGWLVWCLLIVFLIRVEHPPVLHNEPLTPKRRALAILSIVIFVLCFSFTPIRLV